MNDAARRDREPGAEPKPCYVPPPFDSDAPLDPIEQALVRALVRIIVKEIRAEEAAATASTAAAP